MRGAPCGGLGPRIFDHPRGSGRESAGRRSPPISFWRSGPRVSSRSDPGAWHPHGRVPRRRLADGRGQLCLGLKAPGCWLTGRQPIAAEVKPAAALFFEVSRDRVTGSDPPASIPIRCRRGDWACPPGLTRHDTQDRKREGPTPGHTSGATHSAPLRATLQPPSGATLRGRSGGGEPAPGPGRATPLARLGGWASLAAPVWASLACPRSDGQGAAAHQPRRDLTPRAQLPTPPPSARAKPTPTTVPPRRPRKDQKCRSQDSGTERGVPPHDSHAATETAPRQ